MNRLLGNSNEAEARRDENGDEEQLGHVPRQQPQAQQISAREKFPTGNGWRPYIATPLIHVETGEPAIWAAANGSAYRATWAAIKKIAKMAAEDGDEAASDKVAIVSFDSEEAVSNDGNRYFKPVITIEELVPLQGYEIQTLAEDAPAQIEDKSNQGSLDDLNDEIPFK